MPATIPRPLAQGLEARRFTTVNDDGKKLGNLLGRASQDACDNFRATRRLVGISANRTSAETGSLVQQVVRSART